MKILKVTEDEILFDNGSVLTSEHEQDCCESHYVDFTSIIGQGWENADFPEHLKDMIELNGDKKEDETDYYNETWFTFVNLKDKKGNVYILNIYNSNNGYYSENVTLVLSNNKIKESINIQ